MAAPKLSQVLRGLCGLSKKAAEQLANKLALQGNERTYFVTLVAAEHERSKIGKIEARKRIEALHLSDFSEVELERFQIISDWHFFAILELSETRGFDSSPAWIARRLGLSVEKTQEAIQILLDHGWIREDESGRLIQTHTDIATPSGIPSRHIRKHHLQILSKAEAALNLDITQRDFSSMIFAVDPARMDEAKKVLKEFRRSFTKEFGSNATKERVYCLSMQLFPLDKVQEEIPVCHSEEINP